MARRLLVLAAATTAAFALHITPAPAPVPPKDCGFMTVKGHRYNIKSDQLRCRKARKYAKRYLSGGGKPKGHSCQTYGSETAIKFRCQKGARTVFAIRR